MSCNVQHCEARIIKEAVGERERERQRREMEGGRERAL